MARAAICLRDTALNKRIDQELDNDNIRQAAASLEADPPPATGSKTSVVAQTLTVSNLKVFSLYEASKIVLAAADNLALSLVKNLLSSQLGLNCENVEVEFCLYLFTLMPL